MNTDDLVDNLITNMKVIGMVQRGEKLCVRKGQLCKDTDDHFQFVRRWVYKDSRETILMHVRNTILNAIKLTKALLKGDIASDMKDWSLFRISEELKACEIGLQNLKTTYMDDSIMYASLDTLISRLRASYEEHTGLVITNEETNV